MAEMMKMTEMSKEEGILEPDEIELALRRFAMTNNNQALTKLLNSMFPTAKDLVDHELNKDDKNEDMKEGD